MTIALGIVVIIGIVWYFARRGDVPGQSDLADVEEELLRLCLGDRRKAERLLAREAESTPGISRIEAARRAVHFLKRDLK